ncbi:flagellar motor switch protein FliG [Paracoccus sp. S-4012]|uniref:FliG C-terminal domain-containing protein n=1 Tax=Paracoccus sp. S-4012 TaxID=2665648 RepID=UPI0012B0580F|nr:FliG C-terminal domain-containing protein [Paracoccus sp. S-4012]MRX49074.1 flagellar motor switch protein FliG [Paracoccus sp. S-4012]
MIDGADLTSRQKAAVIVRLLLAEGEDISLEALPVELQGALADEMSGMGLIDRTTRDSVIAEFCDRLDAVGLTFPQGLDGTLDLLGARISRDASDRLRRLAALSGRGDPWERIATLPVATLVHLAETEAQEIAAVMFARLPVTKAAESFGRLDPGRARRIAYAMSLTGGIEAPALRRIGQALVHAAEALPQPVLDGGPVEKVGAILNFSPAATRDTVLDGLDEDDHDFARSVRKAIFTWANIPLRIDPRDVPRITRAVDQPVLVRALAGARGADEPTVGFLLGALGSRMADSLREEMETAGKVSAADAEAAMSEVVAAIRAMEAAGDLFLIAGEAEEGEEITISAVSQPG